MRILCVGAGPAGLWFAIAATLLDPAHEITVLERRQPGTTYGWGIVYWDDLIDGVRRIDPGTAREIAARSVLWGGQRVCVQDSRQVHLGGTGFGMGRQQLIDVLADRARELGVRVEYGHDVERLIDSAGADLVVLADGAHSRLRRSRAAAFGTSERLGANKHVWLGSTKPFADFTFAFEHTAAGWIWFHAYRYAPAASTVIVECAEATWRGLGFDTMDGEACRSELQRIFARHLDGHGLADRPDALGAAQWATFPTVRNTSWHEGNVVLLGDCAHTAHFSVGSGTRTAFEDAAALGRAVAGCRPESLSAALQRYQDERLPAVLALQADAERSAAWFEDVDRHIRFPPREFGYALRMRRDPTAVDGANGPRSPLLFGLHGATQWRVGRSARRLVAMGRRRARRVRFQPPVG